MHYWNERYERNDITWDMGQVSPPLQAYFDQLTTLIDISEVLVRSLHEKLLEKRFNVRTLAPCYNSIRPRQGTELFLIAEPFTPAIPPAPAD